MNNLYRSGTNTMIAGVCGGLGEYLRLDPTLVRLVFILLTLFSGFGLLLYLLLLILMPTAGRRASAVGAAARPAAAEPNAEGAGSSATPPAVGQTVGARNALLLLGSALIVIGAAFLLRNLNFAWFQWLGWHTIWPLLLIAIGLAVLLRPAKGE